MTPQRRHPNEPRCIAATTVKPRRRCSLAAAYPYDRCNRHGSAWSPACLAPGCLRPSFASNLCQAHKARYQKHGDPMGGLPTFHGQPAAFMLAASAGEIPADPLACVLWPYSKVQGRSLVYPSIAYPPHGALVHRLILEIKTGEAMPPHIHACHICDTPLCIAPRHLRWGTQIENEQDKKRTPEERTAEIEAAARQEIHQDEQALARVRRQLPSRTLVR